MFNTTIGPLNQPRMVAQYERNCCIPGHVFIELGKSPVTVVVDRVIHPEDIS